MPLAFNSKVRDGANLVKADDRSAFASENSRPLTTKSSSAPSIQQHKKTHPVPLPVMGGSSSLVGSVAEVPLKDAFRTGAELPRTPLKPVSETSLQHNTTNDNNNRPAGGGGRARSLSSATKIPRASQIARSASPFRAPGSAKRRATPSRKGAVKSVVARGLPNTPGGATTKTPSAKKPTASSTPSRANLVPTAEDLAAFARTPKVARTPPGSAATGGRPRAGANLFPVDAVDEPNTKQHLTATASGANPVTVASTATTPQRRRSPKRPPAISFNASGPSNPGEYMEGGNAIDTRLQQQATPFAAAAGTKVSTQKANLSPNAELVDPPASLVFGRSNMLARTPPRTGGKQAPKAPSIPSAVVTDEESQGVNNRCEIDSFNVGVQVGSRIDRGSDGPVGSSCAVPKRASAGGALPSSARVTFAAKLSARRGTAANRLIDAAIALQHVEEQIAEPPPRRLPPTARTSAAAVTGPIVTSAIRGRTTERDSLSSRPPAGDRHISPMPRDVDVSGNVRMLAVGTGEGIELGSGYRGTLTPAMFKGLSSGMRTPSTKTKHASDTADNVRWKVPPMRSLDPASSKRPSIDEAANASTSSQKQRVPPRVGLVRGLWGERSSVAEAAAAAAAAAARRTAALAATAGSDSQAEAETQAGKAPGAEVMRPFRVSSSPAVEASYSAHVAEAGDSVLKEPDLRSVVGGEVIDTAAVDCVAGETKFQRERVGFLQGVRGSDVANSNLDKDVSDDGDGSQNVSPREAPAVSTSPATECGSTPPGTGTAVTSKRERADQESKVGAEAEPFLDIEDPFVGSTRLMRTPPAAAQHAQSAKSPLLPSSPSSSSSIVLESAAEVSVGVDGTKGDGHYCDGDAKTISGEPDFEALGRDVHEGTPRGGDAVSGSSAVGDPFASRNQLPRTPVEQQSAAGGSLADKGPSESSSAGVVPNKEGSRGGGRQAKNLLEAQLEIGELQREVACMADRLAKQTDERNRLAEVAFEAQDDAAGLRQKLQQLQKHNVTKSSGETTVSPTNGRNGNAGRNIEGSTANTEMCGQEDVGGAGSGPSVAVSLVDARVAQLEVEKLECEKEKEEVVRRAMETESELREARAKVREFAEQEVERHSELLGERYKRAQAQCAEDEKRMEERKLKVQLLIADTKAQMLRDSLLEKEEERTEQALRDGAAALASRAAVLLKASCTRNKRMAERIAGLRAGVEEAEQRVELLHARSRVLENAGRAAKDEAATVKMELQEAREALASGKAGAEELCDRLQRSEQECREAQKAHEELRAMITAEESRRMSVERRLSEMKNAGETNISVERARRQSTERRLGIAEQKRAELAIAAATAAGPALRAAVDAERARCQSAERRLNLAERSSAAVEAERKKRLSAERRLELAEREKAELTVAVAAATASAAGVADAAAAAAVASGAARQERNVSRGELLVAETVPVDHSMRKRKRTALNAGETSRGTGRRSPNCSNDDDASGSRLGDDETAPTTANGVTATIGSGVVSVKGKEKRSENKGEKTRLPAAHDGDDAAGMVGSKGKKRGTSTKEMAATVTEVDDDGTDIEHEAVATISQLRRRTRRSTPAVDCRDGCISDDDEPSPDEVAADVSKRKRSAVKESTMPPETTSPDGDGKKTKTRAAIPMTKEDGGGIGGASLTVTGGNDVAPGSRPRHSVLRPSYAETTESPVLVQSIAPAASRSRSRNVAPAIGPSSSPVDADDDTSVNYESESEVLVGKRRRDEGVGTTGGDQDIAKSIKNSAPKGKGSKETLVVTTNVKKRAKTQQFTANKQQAKAKKRLQPSLRGLTSQNEDIERDGCPTADQPANNVNAGAEAEDASEPLAGEKLGERTKTKAYVTTAETTKEAPDAAKGKILNKRAVDAAMPERIGLVTSEKITAIEKKGRRGSGVGPASGRAKRKAEEAATTVPDRVGPEGIKLRVMQERARANKTTGVTAPKVKEDRRHKAPSGGAGANSPSSRPSPRKTATDEDSNDETTSRLVPPVDLAAHKRSRKLRGAGAASCKTPKPKAKAVSASSTAAAPTTASIAEPSVSVTSTTTATTVSRSTAAMAIGEQSLAGKAVVASGARAASASFRTSTESASASAASGFGMRGVHAGGQPVLKTNKAVGTAVLGMRAKSKSGIRGTFFQGFLNPKNGFTVPKLKSAVQQP